ncbi:MAG TPA: alpha/beta hydrolase [Stellaceae bacterium]|nr:alpha/beta hydrolase [Stellaceae bacterium]
MAFVERGDIRLFYEQRGEGPRLLVITGTNGDLRRKPSVLESPLSRRFTLLAYDQRGLGQSTKPDRAYRMADYADDAAQVMDAVGWPSARVLGISFGGMVAQEFALRHPAKVERLALACTAPGGRGGASYPLHELLGLSPRQRAEHLLAVQDTRRDAAWVAADPARAQAALDELTARARPVDPGDPNMAMGSRRQLEARRDHDTFDRLPQLKMPVGLFAGKYDGVAKPEAQEAMRRQIPGAALRFFEGGHLFTMQDPAAYPAIGDFLAG